MSNTSSNSVILTLDNDTYCNKRIDSALSGMLDLPRNQVQNYINSEFVKVNNKYVKKNYKLQCNDIIFISIPPARENAIIPRDAGIEVVYEDSDIVVVNKPPNLVVHPGAAKEQVSVLSALKYRNIKLSNVGAPVRPGVVHRIDKDTSGIIVLAKNDKSHFMLAKQFFSHTIDRRYIGIVYGNLKQTEGIIEKPIARNSVRRKEFCVAEHGKKAKTYFRVIKRLKDKDVVLFKLFTGRTHQIRVHMKYANHPLVGDKVYQKRKENDINRQALHAFFLKFVHPKTFKEMVFYSKLPEDMMKIIRSGG